jgi:hypothetical protein
MLMPITLSSLVGLSAVPPVKIATCDFPITASYGDGDLGPGKPLIFPAFAQAG